MPELALNAKPDSKPRMKRESANKNFLALLLFLILIDQLIKYIIRSSGGFYICNKGIAFGINLPYWLILGLIIVILVFASFLISNFKFQSASWRTNLALALILSGAISNLLDRLYFGCVIDFIDLKIWPIFNLADIFICVGAFLFTIKLNRK